MEGSRIKNKSNNFDEFFIYKNSNQNIILIGEKHDINAESDNMIDIYTISNIIKGMYPTVFTECYNHVTIPHEFMLPSDRDIQVPDDYVPIFDTELHTEGILPHSSHIEKLPHIGTNYRLVLLIQDVFNNFINFLIETGDIETDGESIVYGDELMTVIYNIYNAITRFNLELCEIIDDLTDDFNQKTINMSIIEQKYKQTRVNHIMHIFIHYSFL